MGGNKKVHGRLPTLFVIPEGARSTASVRTRTATARGARCCLGVQHDVLEEPDGVDDKKRDDGGWRKRIVHEENHTRDGTEHVIGNRRV